MLKTRWHKSIPIRRNVILELKRLMKIKEHNIFRAPQSHFYEILWNIETTVWKLKKKKKLIWYNAIILEFDRMMCVGG